MSETTSAQPNDRSPLWLERKSPKIMGKEFRRLFEDGFLIIAGAHDPMAALLAREAGFTSIYLSEGALTASLGRCQTKAN